MTQLKKRFRILRLVSIMGTSLLFLTVLLWVLQNKNVVRANPGTLYVDGATGQTIGTCGTTSTPCQTISHTLNSRASAGDIIRVAQGTYTENLVVNISVVLKGGYESSSWSRDLAHYETVIDGSGNQTVGGDWDGSQVSKPTVIRDGAEYKMWFDGGNLLGEQQVGLAASSNGISWTKYLTNPVLTGTTGAWDESGEHAPFVLKEGGVYKMWYEGSDGSVRQLGYATSNDGTNWNKHAGNPALEAGPEGYDQETAGHGSVLNESGLYKLWYHAIGDQGPIIAHATSGDGLNWTKLGPVLLPEAGRWDEGALWSPSILKLDGMYWMWYSGLGERPPAIGVVTSTNGITWTRFLTAPVFAEIGGAVGFPHVISDSSKLRMWYQDFGQGVINYAESTDGISWTKSLSNPVLTPGTLVAEWGEPVVAIDADNVVLDGFTITGGSAQFAGGVSAGSNTTIHNSVIRDNFADGFPFGQGGGGVLMGGEGSLTIISSRIISNQVNQGAGGVRVHEALLIMTNTVVAGNRGDAGLHLNGPATLWNTTIVNNDGGVLFNPHAMSSALLKVTNSIIYSTGFGIGNPAGSIQVTYSDVEGGWPGTGNLNVPPSFADPATSDYHLSANSPVIDKGINNGAPGTDFEGELRPLDGDLDGTATTDMGADEFKPNQIYLPYTIKNSTS